MLLVLLLTTSLVGLACGSEVEHQPLPNASVTIDPNTVLVIFGTRHGNRNPGKLLPQDPQTWGFEGDFELTSFGKRQGYGLGVELRKFIVNLTSNNYNPSEVQYFSSSANRCQMTLQVATAGLHPPEGYGDWNPKFGDWSPVPYTIDDKLLRMYNEKECGRNAEVWDYIDRDELPSLKKMRDENLALLSRMQELIGWETTKLGVVADVADNLIQIELNNALYPMWMMASISNFNLTFDKLRDRILGFAEAHQNACAAYGPCRGLMAGFWLQHILDKLQAAVDGSHQKVVGYASHTEVTLAVMKLLGIEKEELTTSAGFVLEFRREPFPSVRLLNHDPNPIDEHVIYPATLVDPLEIEKDASGFIDIRKFTSFVRPDAFSNWKAACTSLAAANSPVFFSGLAALFHFIVLRP